MKELFLVAAVTSPYRSLTALGGSLLISCEL